MSTYVHHVPGRLRVKKRAFKENRGCVMAIEEYFEGEEGLRAISHNETTGSLLITYNKQRLQPELVEAMLKDAGCLGKEPVIGLDDVMKTAVEKAGKKVGRACLSAGVGYALRGTPLSFLSAFI